MTPELYGGCGVGMHLRQYVDWLSLYVHDVPCMCTCPNLKYVMDCKSFGEENFGKLK